MDKPSAEAMRIADKWAYSNPSSARDMLAAEVDNAINKGIIAFLEGCDREKVAEVIAREFHQAMNDKRSARAAQSATRALIEQAREQKHG